MSFACCWVTATGQTLVLPPIPFPVKLTVEVTSTVDGTLFGPSAYTIVADDSGNVAISSTVSNPSGASDRVVYYLTSDSLWREQVNGGPCTPTGKNPVNQLPLLQSKAIISILLSWKSGGAISGTAATIRAIPTFYFDFVNTSFFVPPDVSCTPQSLAGGAYFTAPRQLVDFSTSMPILKEITMTSKATCFGIPQAATVFTTVSVVWFGGGVTGSGYLSNCTTASTPPPSGGTNAPIPTPAGTVAVAMPTIPNEFSTTIETTMTEIGNTFTIFEAFSTINRFAKSSLQAPVVDAAGRTEVDAVFVLGSYQLAFSYVNMALPPGQPSYIPSDVRNYFWPDVESCTRVNFGFDLVSGSATTLLLSSATPPTYMGQAFVRGVLCDYWQASSTGTTTQWFWNTNTSSPTLMRITSRGFGRPPLFVHHPFFQQGSPFSSADASTACGYFFSSSDKFCISSGTYSHIHDFIGFVPSVPSTAYLLPAVCSSTSLVQSVPSSPSPSSLSSATVIGIMFLVGIIATALGNCCMWCRMAGKVRDLEFEIQQAHQ